MKAIALAILVLSILAFGVAVAVVSAPTVHATQTTNCGGPGQTPCEVYCSYHPEAPECH